MNSVASETRAVIFGGNGFSGTAIAKRFVEEGLYVSCVSRSGHMPAHLQNGSEQNAWAQKVDWLEGDAAKPDLGLLSACDIVVTTVGSPPIPTVTKSGFDAQYHANGAANIALLNACANTQPKHIIILSANIPAPLRYSKFAYYRGKQDLIDTAYELFIDTDTRVTILKPSVIYGQRHTKSGLGIPLGMMKYPSKLLKPLIPNLTPVSVENVAEACVYALSGLTHSGDKVQSSNPPISNIVKLTNEDLLKMEREISS